MTSAELFGKLREYEMDMTRMADEEQKDKKVKGLTLKTSLDSSENESSSCESESEQDEMNLMVRKFKRFMRKNNNKRKFNSSRKIFKKTENTPVKFTCYECGRIGHIKSECPNKRSNNTDQKKSENDERKKEKFKMKRAYIAWDDNDVSTTSESEEEEEQANLCLMMRHEFDNEVSSDSEPSTHDYNELHDAFYELYKEAKRMKNLNKVLKKNVAELEEELSF
ncbi:hypothetical protein Fmac_033032 [Flemingia macrophylla]|uniref:CCHC-type domain-containing protein n=1 Tax=Flemingia macrophylla TaxID=520843 RepID=A0ABD1L6N0_9FABA